jgi:IS5 family transposase
MIREAIFPHSDPGNAKVDKPRENEAIKRRSKNGTWT